MAQKFFSSNYGSPLMRVDNSGIQQAGEAYGQMFANLGKTIGSTIEKFREGKEKKEQQQRSEDLFLRLYETNSDNPIFSALSIQSTEEAKAVAKDISKDPKLVADAMKFGQMQMDQQKAQRDAELFNLRKSEILRSRRDKDLSQSDERAIARFRTTRPDLRITKDTPASSLPPLDPDPFAAPPTTFKGQAPAVAQLPKSFQLEGKKIIDAVQSGRLSPTQGNRIMNEIQTRAMAEPKPMTPIQEAELEEINLANRKAKRELSELENPKTDYKAGPTIVEDNIFRALDIIKESPRTTTGMGSYLSNIPGTDAKSLKERLASIKANIGFDYLQAMREASPTGGALGNVSDKELQGLQSVFGSLEQSLDDAELTYNLNLLNYTYNNVIHGEGNHNVLDPRKGGNSPQQSANTIDPADLDNAIQAKKKLLEQRTMMQQTLDNPNVPNYGSQ